MYNGINQQQIKSSNQKKILSILKKHGSLARADITKLTSLSPPTVSTNIKDMINQGLIVDAGKGPSLVGKSSSLFALNEHYSHILVIDISSKELRVGLGNFADQILEIIVDDSSKDSQKNIDIIYQIANKLKRRYFVRDLSLISLSCSGVVLETGHIVHVPDDEWYANIDIVKEFQELFEVDVVANNDVNLAAYTEHSKGQEDKDKNLVYLKVDVGVGAGIVLDKKLFVGRKGLAGEIGYSLTKDLRGNDIALEKLIGIPRWLENIETDILRGQKTILSELMKKERLSLKLLKEGVDLHDNYSKDVFNLISRKIAKVAINLISILDIDKVVLGGEVEELGEELIFFIKNYIFQKTPFKVEVDYSNFKKQIELYGALYFGNEHIYKNKGLITKKEEENEKI